MTPDDVVILGRSHLKTLISAVPVSYAILPMLYVFSRKTKIDIDVVRPMKAIACPNCSAPIALQQGVAVQKCSFCDTEVRTDFDSAPEFAELEEKQFEKLLRRASDSEDRGFIKSDLQFRTLAAFLKEKA